MATLHISEADAAADFAALLAHVSAGEQVIIERDSRPVALLTPPEPHPGRTVSDVVTRLKALEEQRGEPLRMGADFADDLEEIVRNRKPNVYENSWD
jgi:antitoxin (DNA-binding transcriptional repressor) of toxin-antitoxin stability system